MANVDVHQHLWTQPLIEALADRRELPFVRRDNGMTVLHAAGERPYLLDISAETPSRRAALVELDGLDEALICLSSALGIESLPRGQCVALLDAYHDAALSWGEPFRVWGAIALEDPEPDDADAVLDRGCVGLSLPAGALDGHEAVFRLRAVLDRLEDRDVPLLVHPGPGLHPGVFEQAALSEPLWWRALTRYVAQMQAAWLAFVTAGRSRHPRLRVIFAMLAGMAPLHVERLLSRGGPAFCLHDPLIFYETSSYGICAIDALAAVVGASQLLYGSDRPIVEPAELDMPEQLDWETVSAATSRALGPPIAAQVAAGRGW